MNIKDANLDLSVEQVEEACQQLRKLAPYPDCTGCRGTSYAVWGRLALIQLDQTCGGVVAPVLVSSCVNCGLLRFNAINTLGLDHLLEKRTVPPGQLQ